MTYLRITYAAIFRYWLERRIRLSYAQFNPDYAKTNWQPASLLKELKRAGLMEAEEVNRLRKRYKDLSQMLHARETYQ